MNIENIYPLSPLQEGLYYHWLSSPSTENYFEQVSYKISGELNIALLEESYRTLVSRHAILRTIFTHEFENKLLQVVKKEGDISFNYIDVNSIDVFSLSDFKKADRIKGFDLNKGPQMRLSILGYSNNSYEFIWSHHHILMDGWCVGVLIKEFFQIYYSLIHGKTPQLSKAYPYSNYINWLNKIDTKDALNYWKFYLLDYHTISTLPKLNAVQTNENLQKEKTLLFDASVCQSIKDYCKESGITESTFFQSVWGILLCKYNNTQDVVFGSVVSGRPAELAGIEEMIGLFINTIPVRIQLKDNLKIKELFKEVQQNSVKSTKYHYTQLADVQVESELNQKLFDHILAFENYPIQELVKQNMGDENIQRDLKLVSTEVFEQTNYNFSVIIVPGNAFKIKITFNENIHSSNLIERLLNHLNNIINQILKTPSISFNELEYLSDIEIHQLLKDFNDSESDYPANKSIVDLFKEQVKKTPDKIAIVFEETKLSYRELDAQSDNLASYLKNNYKIKADALVGILLNRSEYMIIAILGILKSGGAYVPIDPEYPKERKEFILNDTALNILITHSDFTPDLDFYTRSIFAINIHLNVLNNPVEFNNETIQPNNLAYVLYTSGSTGVPKGVMVDHTSVVRLVKSINYIKLKGDEVLLSTGAITFDATTFEYWSMLLNGGRLVICSNKVLKDSRLLSLEIENQLVNVMWFTSSWLNHLVDNEIELFGNLKTVLTGGEKLSPAHINTLHLKYPKLEIINGYGPTENTTFSLTYSIKNESTNIPIGKPINNGQVYILDRMRNLLPIGVEGEIYLSGKGLARGYLNNPELTDEYFLINPIKKSERIYNTGDFGRWLPDGNIEFIGRRDNQVKIHGYRIELSEIENAIRNFKLIRDVVVISLELSDSDRELVAYIVGNEDVNQSDIREYLSKKLPFYMFPKYFIQLDSLPITKNGKVDKKALPHLKNSNISSGKKYIIPENETEIKLSEIWSEVLEIDKVSLNDDFFELGGHSLKAMKLLSRIHKTFEVKLEFNDLFVNTVLKEQANLISRTIKTTYSGIQPAKANKYYPLSSAQRRLWVLSKFEGSNTAYNISGAFLFEGNLDITALKNSFSGLINRHEILRTVFKENENGDVFQHINTSSESTFEFTYKDLRNEIDPQEKIRIILEKDSLTPFDLSEGFPLRAGLIQFENHKWVFHYTMHHIISDDWSLEIMTRELFIFYNYYKGGVKHVLPKLKLQYKDFAAWQQKQLNNSQLTEHRAYWLKQFEDGIPVIKLTTDKIRPVQKTYNGGAITRHLNKSLINKIKSISQAQGGTLFMGLLAIVNVLLYRYTGQEDIVIGSSISGREHLDLEDQIGFYLNALALRARLKADDSFTVVLEKVKQTTLNAYKHQTYPFDELVNELPLQRDISRSPLFDVMVDLINKKNEGDETRIISKDLKITAYKTGNMVPGRFDLTFNFIEIDDGLNATIVYNRDLFENSTIERLLNHLEQLLEVLETELNEPIKNIDFLSIQEKHKLLVEFNTTTPATSGNKNIINLFEKQVSRTPDYIAVKFNEVELTYKDLDEKSNQLANYLIHDHSIQAGDLIGIMIDRSEKMIIAILGILKAGAAYVPVDPSYPKARKKLIIENAAIKILITQSDYIFDLEFYSGSIFAGDIQMDSLNTSTKSPGLSIQKNTLAYVIYTSGSTGTPKGCSITHNNLSHYIRWADNYYFSNSSKTNFGFFTSLAFDLTVTSIFCSLTRGGKLIIYNQTDDLTDILRNNFNEKSGIDCIKLTPSHVNIMKYLNIHSTTMQCAIVGGENVTREHVSILKSINPSIAIYNEYGPTETTVGCIVKQLEENTPVLIGKPISETGIYILSEGSVLCPIGIPGEICIAGPGLAQGYLGDPKLTKRKFVSNPFKPEERMYKTGDLGKWLPDGNIEFIGRSDDQVKIRGHRIELGEIEHALTGHSDIAAAKVVIRTPKTNEPEIAAYIVSNNKLNDSGIRSYLKSILPSYLIPDHIIQIEEMPLTSNGKIDKTKLTDLQKPGSQNNKEIILPRNETEDKLAAIWKGLLNKEAISINDNFFDLGGHSLKAIRLATQIQNKFGVRVDLKDLFTIPLFEDQAILIKKSKFTPHRNSHIVNLNQENANVKYNLYFIPPVFGNPALYRSLADKLQNEFNCFGLQYKGLNTDEIFYASIEQAAVEFCDEIIQNQTDNKYIILGYSLGAIIAFEVAKILENKNKSVQLILVDKNVLSNSIRLFNGIFLNKEVKFLYNKYRSSILDEEVDSERLHLFLSNNIKIQNKYIQKGKIKSDIYAFESTNNKIKTNMHRWKKHTEGNVEVNFIDGEHWEAFSECNLDSLKNILITIKEKWNILTN